MNTSHVTFGHGDRHITGLNRDDVENAIRRDLQHRLLDVGDSTRRTVAVSGVLIEYRAFRVDETRTHVGTYYPL